MSSSCADKVIFGAAKGSPSVLISDGLCCFRSGPSEAVITSIGCSLGLVRRSGPGQADFTDKPHQLPWAGRHFTRPHLR